MGINQGPGMALMRIRTGAEKGLELVVVALPCYADQQRCVVYQVEMNGCLTVGACLCGAGMCMNGSSGIVWSRLRMPMKPTALWHLYLQL